MSGKLDRLQTFLVTTGSELTAAQIRSRFGLLNPTAAVSELRRRGVCVYANRTTLYDGTPTTKYRVGTPSRDIVAFAAANGYFSV